MAENDGKRVKSILCKHYVDDTYNKTKRWNWQALWYFEFFSSK